MKTRTLIALSIVSLLLFSACSVLPKVDPGLQTTETREVSGFHAVRLNSVGDLRITQGDTDSLEIEAGENILPHIKTEVKDGILVIGMDDPQWSINLPTPIVFHISVQDLDSIDLTGAGNIQAGGLKTDDLKINLSGAGNIAIENLEAKTVDTSLSGAGNISLGGAVKDQAAFLAGLGSYQAGDLESENAKVEVAGAGGATVWATKVLDVIISGAGSVEYFGFPKISENISGVGSVRSLGNK